VVTPWGRLSWVASYFNGYPWTFLGCISREERCLSALAALGPVAAARLVRVFDEDPDDAAAERAALDARRDHAQQLFGLPRAAFRDEALLASIDQIEDIIDECARNTGNLVIDISCFPKRWFFLLTRLALQDPRIQNLMATYTVAGAYGQTLSYNPEIVRTLPGFTSMHRRGTCDVALVSIGFHSHSILDLFDVERPKSVRMLFPFPPGPPGVGRNWRFVEKLEGAIRTSGTELTEVGRVVDQIHIGALDLPQNFYALSRATDGATKTSLVAPYGPKPVSLAMCLFVLAAERSGRPEVPAYYTQPMRYAADYTSGVLVRAGVDEVLGYPIRVDGRDLYQL
jgi:hypothetical protein